MELLNGDCLEKMKDLETDSVDLLFCDLPYGQTACKWDCLIDLELFWKEVNRVCKITAPMFFTCSTKFGVSLINSNPKNFRYDMVWVKSAPVGFLNAKKMPMKKHEMVYVFYRKLPFYNIDDNHTHKFRKERTGRIKGVEKRNTNKNSVLYGNIEDNGYTSKERRESGSTTAYTPPLPTTILEVASQKGKHPTQKPTALMEWVLKYYTRENDLVLDPTMGSGSTGLACKNTNRKFIGIEKDIDIFNTAVDRLK